MHSRMWGWGLLVSMDYCCIVDGSLYLVESNNHKSGSRFLPEYASNLDGQCTCDTYCWIVKMGLFSLLRYIEMAHAGPIN